MSLRLPIRWLSQGEGGRPQPPEGGRVYGATAQVVDKRLREDYSIFIRLPAVQMTAGSSYIAEAEFLRMDIVGQFPAPGTRVFIKEGPRVVAEGLVLSTEPPTNA